MDLEIKIEPGILGKIDSDVDFLILLKHKLLRLTDILGTSIPNINTNCINILKLVKGTSDNMFRMLINDDNYSKFSNCLMPTMRVNKNLKMKALDFQQEKLEMDKENAKKLDFESLENSFLDSGESKKFDMQEFQK